MPKSPLFSVIMDTYYRPAMLREAVDALFRQTYGNLEIILINNAATAETVEYLNEVAALDKRVRLLHFKENQYSPDDPVKMLDTCLNPALKMATGDYVWYQSDDDLIADDYVEKMVALFQGNPECTTAAGLSISMDVERNVIPEPRISNFRPRYIAGHTLILDCLRGGKMFSAPGTIFTIKRDVLIKAGGYHRNLEHSQLYGIVPFGVTGFDETAIFYWRRHQSQLNKQLHARGWTSIAEKFALLKEWEIERRWQVFGKDTARKVVSTIERQIYEIAAKCFAINLVCLRFRASLRVIGKVWNRPQFWPKVPKALFEAFYRRTRQLLHHLKPAVRGLFKIWPGLASASVLFARLRDKAD
jgi:glycosyltransferase involved in cell wall biosynthesis